MYLLLITIALIVHGSLYPWDFDLARVHSSPFQVLLHSWPAAFDAAAQTDAITNIAFYFPLGVAAFLWLARNCRLWLAAVTTLCLGAGLSTTMELLQVWVPGRVSSLEDVDFNIAGTALGVLTAILFHRRLEALYQGLARGFHLHFASSGTLLLACWTAYQLFPFTPQIKPGSLPYEFEILLHPNSLFGAEIWVNVAEWFAVALILQSMRREMTIPWLLAGVGFRIAIRPLLLTRVFALDELAGVALALLVWAALREEWRLQTGLATMASAILLRSLTLFHFSHLPSYLGPGGLLLRRGFDYGAMVWMLYAAGWSRLRAGLAVVASVVVILVLQEILPGRSPSFSGPILAVVMALALWLSEIWLPMASRQ